MAVRIHHVSLFVSDLERSVAFYSDLLGLREVRRVHLDGPGFWCVFMNGSAQDSDLVLTRRDDGEPPPADKRELFHVAYGVDPEAFTAIADRLRAEGTPFHGPVDHEAFAEGPQQRRALYLTDPDGHVVEITENLHGGGGNRTPN